MNQSLDAGWVLEPGQVLLTGVLGHMIPAEAGDYVADFGALGKISFQIK